MYCIKYNNVSLPEKIWLKKFTVNKFILACILRRFLLKRAYTSVSNISWKGLGKVGVANKSAFKNVFEARRYNDKNLLGQWWSCRF